MRINTRLGRLELLRNEQVILDKADELTALIAKHGDGELKEEANKAGFHLERLKKKLANQGKEEPVNAPY